jgi:hypothetical protein
MYLHSLHAVVTISSNPVIELTGMINNKQIINKKLFEKNEYFGNNVMELLSELITI